MTVPHSPHTPHPPLSAQPVTVSAPAKVNLFLHILGKDARDYHQLDSLAAFCAYGDRLTIAQAPQSSLTMSGEFGHELETSGPPEHNLLWRVLDTYRAMTGKAAPQLAIGLEKNIPLGGGLGGGSADAAALLNVIRSAYDPAIDSGTIAEKLGSDIKACLYAPDAVRMQGTGNTLAETGLKLPYTPLLLVNPRQHCPTPLVYSRVTTKDYSQDGLDLPPMPSAEELAHYLKSATRNDLTRAAIETAPIIAQVLEAIETTRNCRLARLSGSGATSFGLYADDDDCRRAALEIKTTHPDWWAVATSIGHR